jgi:hypothetical protein
MLFLALFILPTHASFAVRPFVTDDAIIVDYGQVEIESWMEVTHAEGNFGEAPGVNYLAGITPLDWLEVMAGSGFGRAINNRWGIARPFIQTKMLFLRAEANGDPGLAFASGATFDVGETTVAAGSIVDESSNPKYKLGTNYYAIGLMTYRLLNDSVQLHTNFGLRAEHQRERGLRMRPYWGIGLDAAIVGNEIHAIAEAYAGDPLGYNAAMYAGQFGARWICSDYVNIDLTFGAKPEMNKNGETESKVEVWGQLGLRLLFDAFTHDGNPGSPDGSRGLFSFSQQ